MLLKRKIIKNYPIKVTVFAVTFFNVHKNLYLAKNKCR